jgi:exopolysaccharide biosynthesis polyprenyl glycosylphosphotransferase
MTVSESAETATSLQVRRALPFGSGSSALRARDGLAAVVIADGVAMALATIATSLTLLRPLITLALLVAWPTAVAYLQRGLTSSQRLGIRHPVRAAVGLVAAIAIANSIDARPIPLRLAVVTVALAVLASIAVRLLLPLVRLVPISRRENVVLVGSAEGVAEIASRWNDSKSAPHVVGACLPTADFEDDAMYASGGQVRLLGSPGQAADVASSVDADRVAVLPGSGLSHSDLRRLSWKLERAGARLSLITPLQDVGVHRVRTRTTDGRLMIDVLPRKLQGTKAAVKSVVEWLMVALLSLVIVPVIGLLAVLVRVESRGPSLFRQTRIGTDGKPFTMLKLRTMCADAPERQAELAAQSDHGDTGLFKMRDDPRMTRIGKILRRTSLDELPQIFNVLRGEMALIGPRPALPHELARYDDWSCRRLDVKPGMTGLWQVSGRADLSWDEAVHFDLEYVDNWDPVLDLTIAARTFGAVVSTKGAY